MLYCIGYMDGPGEYYAEGGELAFHTREDAEAFLSSHPKKGELYLFEVEGDWQKDTTPGDPYPRLKPMLLCRLVI